jgi:protein-disulfide isomerase
MKHPLTVALGIALSVISISLGVVLYGQQRTSEIDALRKEIEALKARQQTLESQLAQLLAALRGESPDPKEVSIDLSGAPSRGEPDAKVTMVEFSDFQCPYCGRHFRETMPKIDSVYIKTGKVRYIFKDFPIETLHPQAPKAHEAANCAGDQDRYWDMWYRFFTYPQQLTRADLSKHATAAGLDVRRFDECLDSGKYAKAVEESVQQAMRLGATGTPYVFLGVTEPGSDTLKATRLIRGAFPYERFKSTIDELLAQ